MYNLRLISYKIVIEAIGRDVITSVYLLDNFYHFYQSGTINFIKTSNMIKNSVGINIELNCSRVRDSKLSCSNLLVFFHSLGFTLRFNKLKIMCQDESSYR
jgi:hypothetical protein